MYVSVTLRNAIISRYTRKRRHHVCARVTPRNVTGSSPRDRLTSLCTALCITALSDDRRLRFVSLRCQTTADIYRQRSSISKLEEDAS